MMQAKDLLTAMTFGSGGSGGGGGGYPEPEGTKAITITENGTTTENVKDFASVSIETDVPNTYAQEDEGKVVSGGQLYSQMAQSVSQNGDLDTTFINLVSVDVPNSYSQSDEGKVVSNGALVSQTTQYIVANGTYNTTKKRSVTVDVPNSFSASDEGKVVSGGQLVSQGTNYITENGVYDTTEVREVEIDVAGGGGEISRLQNLLLAREDYEYLPMTISYKDSENGVIGPYFLAGVDATGMDLTVNFGGDLTEDEGSKIPPSSFLGASFASLAIDPTDVTFVGKSAFSGCSADKRTNLDLHAVQTIEYAAFEGCTAFSDVDVGPNCNYITGNAFKDSTVDKIVLRRTSSRVVLGNVSALSNCNAIIYVPDDMVAGYQTATNWSSISNSILPISDYFPTE